MLPCVASLKTRIGELVVPAERDRGRVHDADTVGQKAVERHVRVHARVREMHRVALVNPLDLRRLEERVGVDLHRAEGRRGVGREVRVASAGREDDEPTLLEMPHRAPSNVRLGDLTDLHRRLHARGDAGALERVLQCEGVHHRREHPHVVALRAVHPDARALEAAEDVPPADDDADLHAERVHLGELCGRRADDVGVDPEPAVAPARASPLSLSTMRRYARPDSAGGGATVRPSSKGSRAPGMTGPCTRAVRRAQSGSEARARGSAGLAKAGPP